MPHVADAAMAQATCLPGRGSLGFASILARSTANGVCQQQREDMEKLFRDQFSAILTELTLVFSAEQCSSYGPVATEGVLEKRAGTRQ